MIDHTFQIADREVSNGQYLRFLQTISPSNTDLQTELEQRRNRDAAKAAGEVNYGYGYFNIRSHAPAACGSTKCNSWGCFDMHGNVAELCQFSSPAPLDENPNVVMSVITLNRANSPIVNVRGGAWGIDKNRNLMSSAKWQFAVLKRWRGLGFRIARSPIPGGDTSD